MINTPESGTDPSGYEICPGLTPDLPGIFLSEKAAQDFNETCSKRYKRRYKIVKKRIYEYGWVLVVWLVVPIKWSGEGMDRLARLKDYDQGLLDKVKEQ